MHGLAFFFQFIAAGTVCRDAVNSCDVPEYCNGTSEVVSYVICISNVDWQHTYLHYLYRL
jgi:predicted transcriptional regulator of viral defense system